eukprot:2291854-Heterocapsa_arctica.AAC.1
MAPSAGDPDDADLHQPAEDACPAAGGEREDDSVKSSAVRADSVKSSAMRRMVRETLEANDFGDRNEWSNSRSMPPRGRNKPSI